MPRTTAASLAVRALEEVGVTHTFGIPGVHNTELYDELDRSEKITPVLVTSEFNGGFMADAMSRVGSGVGCLALVPAAGFTHAASGIGEAMLDGIPMLVITGGVRSDGEFGYQLHQMDQLELAKGLTKAAFRAERVADVPGMIHEAYRIATTGTPGPVLVELPVNLQMQAEDAPDPEPFVPAPAAPLPPAVQLDKAAEILLSAEKPVLYVGWGARRAREDLVRLAEALGAPVVTTLQGVATFPHDHPLHAGFCFGPAAVPSAREAAEGHDAMLAVGARFGEIATGSFGIDPPRNLVHVDIDPAVIDRNYPARIGLVGDAAAILPALLERVSGRAGRAGERAQTLAAEIAKRKSSYRADFLAHDSGDRVNPAALFDAVDARVGDDCLTTVDDGNHTFLAAELWPLRGTRDFISPTDFNAMGYAVPAGIAAALAHPGREVVTFVGDGCFRMTGSELVTASALGLGLVVYVFDDGELAQIAQAQALPYNRKTCTVMPTMAIEHLAAATGSELIRITGADDLAASVDRAHTLAAEGRPVVVDVHIDYSRSSTFTQGIIKTNFKRFPTRDKLRIAGRAVSRKITG